MSAIYVTDPATNESVTLSELARRHKIHVSTLSRRYAEGLRGKSLVKPFSLANHNIDLQRKAREAAERRYSIMLSSMAGLRLPLNHIAEAGKMVGGGQ